MRRRCFSTSFFFQSSVIELEIELSVADGYEARMLETLDCSLKPMISSSTSSRRVKAEDLYAVDYRAA